MEGEVCLDFWEEFNGRGGLPAFDGSVKQAKIAHQHTHPHRIANLMISGSMLQLGSAPGVRIRVNAACWQSRNEMHA